MTRRFAVLLGLVLCALLLAGGTFALSEAMVVRVEDGIFFQIDGDTITVLDRVPAGVAPINLDDVRWAVREKIDPDLLYDEDGDDKDVFLGDFAMNLSIRTVVFSEGIENIAPIDAFEAFARLERIVFPSTAKQIDMRMKAIASVSAFEVAQGNPLFTAVDGVLFAKDGKTLVLFPPGKGAAYAIPEGTEHIAPNAFRDNMALKSVSLPRSMTRIGERAFSRCFALQTVSLPITLTHIEKAAFYECLALDAVVIPPGVQVVETRAFVGCEKLREVVVPSAQTKVEPGAINSVPADIAIYAPEGSWAHRWAMACGMRWAEPGGTARRLTPSMGEAAVVNNPDRDDTLALYEAATTESHLLGQYENGTTVEVLGWTDDWAHVVIGTEIGYMKAGPRPEGVQTGLPSDGSLLMRMGPLTDLVEIQCDVVMGVSYSYEYEGVMYEGEGSPLGYAWMNREAPSWSLYDISFITPTAMMGEWGFVKEPYYNHFCYTPLDMYRPVTLDTSGKQFALVYNPDWRDRLNFRDAPSRSGNLIGKYFNGTQMEILGESGDWLHVRIGGREGYVMSAFVKRVEPNEWTWGF